MKKIIFTTGLAMLASVASAVVVVGDENAQTINTDSNTIVKVTQSGTLTVTKPGEIEILLVGGGGGGGKNDSANSMAGGGGGAGGVIHRQALYVGKGNYPVTIGAGGAVFVGNNAGTANGGNTTAFGLTAYGGGYGAHAGGSGMYGTVGSGGSGGGGSKGYGGTATPGGSQSAAAREAGNLGNAGFTPESNAQGGGGGGAGGAATSGIGGVGYECDITEESVWYAGGGYSGSYWGGNSAEFGGGNTRYGGGGHKGQTGGAGIVIVRFSRVEWKTSDNFAVEGYDVKGRQANGYAHLIITNSTTLHVTGSAPFEVLLVGGGGGAGAKVESYHGGGGGGGGVVHIQDILVSTGDYAITIGAGGPVNGGGRASGGATTAFGFTAYGGGPGAYGYGGGGLSIDNLGASGGGGTTGSGTVTGGKAKAYPNNLGNDGANAAGYHVAGGGGGAGAAGNGVAGGDGYSCDITGETAYYAGGGGGGRMWNVPGPNGLGGGMENFGGGGTASSDYRVTTPQTGGPGIVIIRYKRPESGTAVFLR